MKSTDKLIGSKETFTRERIVRKRRGTSEDVLETERKRKR